jgi:aryl-alcohol dehydrogenase-like predicted oxidoreductase
VEQRQLGAHGPRLSTIGFGAWAVGGEGGRFNWGPQDDRESIAARHGKTVGQLAIAWVLRLPGVTSAIAGARRPEQVAANVGGAG